MSKASTRAGYDEVAEAYAEHYLEELAKKPLDRAMLDAFAETSRAMTLDLGCGPGQVARHLASRGVVVEGVDLSPAMIAIAKRLHPDLAFRTGDMLALPQEAASVSGIVAFYAIVNLAPEDLGTAFREMHRVLVPGGHALVSFHVRDGQGHEGGHVHLEEMLGRTVSMDFWFHPVATVEERAREAGFTREACLERQPYADVEYPSERAYLLLRAR